MIILDTHIWFWRVDTPAQLRRAQMEAILEQENDSAGVIGICATSIWEIAKLVQIGRIQLDTDLSDWFENALVILMCVLSTCPQPSQSGPPLCRVTLNFPATSGFVTLPIR